MYYVSNHIRYLEGIAALIKVSSSIEHQIAETSRRNWQIPMKAQRNENLHKIPE